MFAHSTFSIRTEWIVALSIVMMDKEAVCGGNFFIKHTLKDMEFISL
jgi:hypothetical protein